MPQDGRPNRSSSPVPDRESGEHARTSGTQFVVDDIDLSAEQQQRVSDLFLRLAESNFYELLGVARTADKKTIKRAYNAVVVEFHPDRFFRKRLGTFKPKMEAIIERMTDAQEILCDAERRGAYDAALRTNRQSLIDGMIEDAMKEMASAASGRYEVLDVEEVVELRSMPARPTPPPPRMPTPEELEARRQTLARKLSARPMPLRSPTVPPKKPEK